MYICICNAVTERDIERCVSGRSNCSLEDLQQELGVAAGCGCCRDAAKAALDGHARALSPSASITRCEEPSACRPLPLLKAA